jgi:CHAT domain-containing protein/tetratricopeptide (TPR) repeat protein
MKTTFNRSQWTSIRTITAGDLASPVYWAFALILVGLLLGESRVLAQHAPQVNDANSQSMQQQSPNQTPSHHHFPKHYQHSHHHHVLNKWPNDQRANVSYVEEYVEVTDRERIELNIRVETVSGFNAGGTIRIPKNSVVTDGTQQYLFVENGERFDRVPVSVVSRDSGTMEIADNGRVFPGQMIAVSGVPELREKSKTELIRNAIVPHAGHAHKSPSSIVRPLKFEAAELLAKGNVATAQEQLAQLYIEFGHYDAAIDQLKVAISHFASDTNLLSRHTDAVNLLARVYLEMGQFVEAKQLLDENVVRLSSETIDVSGSTKQTDTLGDTLALLAELYRETGDFKQAETFHSQILKRRRDLFGEEHRQYAVALHNYGIFKWRQERFQFAEELLQRELQITEELAPNSRDSAHSRESLALAKMSLGKLSEAASLFQAALKIYDSLPGNERDRYRTLSNLAFLHIFDGKHDEALTLFSEAANGRKALLGEEHLDYADTLADAARLRLMRGEFERAVAATRHSLAITRRSLELTSAAQSERQQLAMASLFRDRLDLLLTAAEKAPETASDTFSEILAWKGSTLVRQRAMRQLSQQESIASKYKQLQVITMRIASLTRTTPSSTEEIAAWKATLSSMMSQKESVEAELSQASVDFDFSRTSPSLASLAGALPKDAVLVDYFAYDKLSPHPTKGQFQRSPSLMASIVKPGGSVKLVYFGSATVIAGAIDTWRETFGISPESRSAGRRLRRAIWEPILPAIGDATTILVSNDGPLGRLPLAALPGRAENSYLIEDHRIAMVPVPQMIPSLVTRSERRELPKHLLVMGDVDYDDPAQGLLAVNQTPSPLPWDRGGMSRARAGSESFARLQHTAGEIAVIERLYKNQGWSKSDGIVILDRQDATEARFRELAPQCYQLHLATHGFFAAPSVSSADNSQSPPSAKRLVGEDGFTIRGVSPGLLSGLAFSGANAKPQPNRDDGILTADEIAFLPLDGVELVVLSACETGLGEVAGGEGLLGIQRSFQVSGARTTVASLWKVPDLATRLLMEQFYKNYWGKEKMSRLDAMRAAQLWVLNHPDDLRGVSRDAEELRNRKTPPEYWGAFVLSGDWR